MTPAAGNRRGPRALTLVVIGLLAACSSHPVGPARTFASYERKAKTTAESALSAVETVRLAAQTGAKGRGTGPFLGVVISDQEEALAKVQGTFGSIQPPDHHSDELRTTLDDLISRATDHVAAVRIAVRRGQLHQLDAIGRPLGRDAQALRTFLEAHG